MFGYILESILVLKLEPPLIPKTNQSYQFETNTCFILGKVIGVCSGIILTPDLGHMGQFIVMQQYRGQGIGSALWSKAMAHIGNERNVSLFSSPKMIQRYKRNGFAVEFEKWLTFFVGEVDHKLMIKHIDGISVEALNEKNIEKVIEYDRQICGGIDRRVLIEGLHTYDDNVTLIAVNEDRDVVGYCVVSETDDPNQNESKQFVRTDQNFADTPLIGELLLSKCIEAIDTTSSVKIWFRCYATNKHFTSLAQRLGLEFLMKEPLLFSKRIHIFENDKINSPSKTTFFPC